MNMRLLSAGPPPFRTCDAPYGEYEFKPREAVWIQIPSEPGHWVPGYVVFQVPAMVNQPLINPARYYVCAWDGRKQNFFEIIPEHGSLKPHCKNMRFLLAWEGKYPQHVDLIRYHAEEMYRMMMMVKSIPHHASTAETRRMNRSKPLCFDAFNLHI